MGSNGPIDVEMKPETGFSLSVLKPVTPLRYRERSPRAFLRTVEK